MRIHKLILIIAFVALSACDRGSKTGPSQTGRVVAVVAPGSLRTRLESTGAWFMESQQTSSGKIEAVDMRLASAAMILPPTAAFRLSPASKSSPGRMTPIPLTTVRTTVSDAASTVAACASSPAPTTSMSTANASGAARNAPSLSLETGNFKDKVQFPVAVIRENRHFQGQQGLPKKSRALQSGSGAV